ncbi:MAG: GNAT family N-acetyltransferase, partial [Nitriliruptoraceae bacterium]
SEESVARRRRVAELDRLIAATDRTGQVVGTAGAFSFEISLPGGRSAPCAGITLVSVRADHRRRGLLTRMMTQLLDDAAARGEPFAALWASESPIYGRFGFGPAAPTLQVQLRREAAALHLDGPVDEVELVDADTAAARFPAIYDAYRAMRPGALSYDERWWRGRILDDPSHRRERSGPLRFALLADRGFATYRVSLDWGDDGPAGSVQIEELVAFDAAAHAALWRFVVDTDLTVTTSAVRRPVDDPLFAQLVDPGRARVVQGDPLQLRLVDVPAALTARSYKVDGSLVLEVIDRFRPAAGGRWRMEVVDGVASLEPTRQQPDVALDTTDLAAVALGGNRATQLAAAGRLDATRASAAMLDRLLASDVAPCHGGMF